MYVRICLMFVQSILITPTVELVFVPQVIRLNPENHRFSLKHHIDKTHHLDLETMITPLLILAFLRLAHGLCSWTAYLGPVMLIHTCFVKTDR